MKKLIALSSALVSGSALAHSGDHGAANLAASLSHVFNSAEHAVAAVVVLGVVGSIAAFAARRQAKAKAVRAD